MLIRRKNKGPLISADCDHPVMRMVMLMGIFAMTASAFWWHFERRIAEIIPPDGSYLIINEDKILQKEDLKKLNAWRDAFYDEWGMRVLIMASAGEALLPEFSGPTLFVGVGLEHNQATIVFPPLARKALGEGLRTVTEEKLAQCIKETPAGACLDEAMQSLWAGFE